MKTSEIRNKFIQFFEAKQHTFVEGASTIPIGDQTLLFTIAGMTQFKLSLTGEEVRLYKRATNSQKCIRVADLDDVGKDGRHLTMFEMLGSWSFGDYYKVEAIHWAYEFVKDELKLDLSKLWTTVHHSDDESYEIWKSIGIPENRIVRLGDKDNFWAMGPTGPCGPCSELYLDQGPEVGRCNEKSFDCKKGPGCDCDRYLEFWNLVFMQFNRQKDGTLADLPMKSVDTGSGLERVAALVQGKQSAFDIDVFVGIKNHILKLADINNVEKNLSDEEKQCLNVIADHIRMLTFTLGDGARFSNEGRGYVLRRVLRRAVRFIHKLAPQLNKNTSFLAQLVNSVVEEFGDFYPEIKTNKKMIEQAIEQEEIKFKGTLETGLEKFHTFVDAAKKKNSKQLSGEDAFILHDSFGFPLDLTLILCEEISFSVDRDGFEKHMKAQKERSRAEAKFYKFSQDDSPWFDIHAKGTAGNHNDMIFNGYDIQDDVEIPAHHVKKIRQLKNNYFELVFANTPFYPEGGGQVSDKGTLSIVYGNLNYDFDVLDVRKTPTEIIHLLQNESLSSENLDQFYKNLSQSKFIAKVDLISRKSTSRNHTATHLMHKALQIVLGENVRQAGSLVQADSLRFDFTHAKAMTKEQIDQVELIVNEEILKNTSVITHENVALDKAKAMGAMAMFDEKYESKVRVLEVPQFSLELCGGTHVASTGEIGLFKIISEGSVTSGVRRVEALTGHNSLHYLKTLKGQLVQIAENLKCAENDIPVKLSSLKENIKNSENELLVLQNKLADYKFTKLIAGARVFSDDLKCIATIVEDSNLKELEILCDKFKQKEFIICIIGCVIENKAQIMCSLSKKITEKYKNLSAGNIVKHICQFIDGKGGGRPDFARGSGTNHEQLPLAISKTVDEYLKGFI